MLQDQPRRQQSTPRLEQAAQQRRRDVERRVRDDVIRPPRQSELGGIGLHDDDASVESLAEALRAAGMGLHRDDSRARIEERGGDCAGAGADVEDGGTGGETRVSDEPSRPGGVELVPPPTPP
jgi:hypothetical protein